MPFFGKLLLGELPAVREDKTQHPLSLCRKCGDLEEELKNVTNNLKSLEAASEKVGWLELEGDWLDVLHFFPQGTQEQAGVFSLSSFGPQQLGYAHRNRCSVGGFPSSVGS